jgi:LEA14-like dessication related protein
MLQRVFIVFIAFGLAACSGLPLNTVAPKVSVAGVEIKGVSLFEQRFDVALRVSNPNDFDLKIEALEFDLDVNGRPFATGLAPGSTLIAAASSTVLKVDATTQSRNIIEQIKRLSSESIKEGVPYRITGRIKTDRSSRWIPFEHTGVYGADEKNPKGRTI